MQRDESLDDGDVQGKMERFTKSLPAISCCVMMFVVVIVAVAPECGEQGQSRSLTRGFCFSKCSRARAG